MYPDVNVKVPLNNRLGLGGTASSAPSNAITTDTITDFVLTDAGDYTTTD